MDVEDISIQVISRKASEASTADNGGANSGLGVGWVILIVVLGLVALLGGILVCMRVRNIQRRKAKLMLSKNLRLRRALERDSDEESTHVESGDRLDEERGRRRI
jgi:Na+/pantothenate symporter